jgi:hypothetical protein
MGCGKEHDMADEGKPGKGPLGSALVPLVLGVGVLVNFTGSAGYPAYRAVDMLRLIGVGMLFGVALTLFFHALRERKIS